MFSFLQYPVASYGGEDRGRLSLAVAKEGRAFRKCSKIFGSLQLS
jgi:hypothetical protein